MKAFPTNVSVATGGDSWRTEYGMDLRDYFAAKALQAMIPVTIKSIGSESIEIKDVCIAAYGWANMMMEARK